MGEIYGIDLCIGKRLPLIQVPTTAGTGSEVTNISVITTGQAEKKGVGSAQLYADYAVLDGDLTTTIPPKTTAATGIDAMVHAIEAFTSKHKKNVLSDVLAKEALSLLGSNIKRACVDGNDREARMAMLLGSLYAGMAFSNSPCAAVHALAYPIGSHFHVPHGLSNSLMLPHVLRFTGEDPSAQHPNQSDTGGNKGDRPGPALNRGHEGRETLEEQHARGEACRRTPALFKRPC